MKILIADHQALFRDELRSLIEAQGSELVGEAEDGLQTLRTAHLLAPDLLLMDLSMPGLDGLATVRRLTAELPDLPIVILAATEDDRKVRQAIEEGAQGYLLKDLRSDSLAALLEKVEHGEPLPGPPPALRRVTAIAPPVARAGMAVPHPDALTEKERQVLALLASGVDSNLHLAAQLGISQNTVKTHVRQILDKLDLHSRGQAIAYAYRHGLVAPPKE